MGWVFGFGVLVGLIFGVLFSAPLMKGTANLYMYAHPMDEISSPENWEDSNYRTR